MTGVTDRMGQALPEEVESPFATAVRRATENMSSMTRRRLLRWLAVAVAVAATTIYVRSFARDDARSLPVPESGRAPSLRPDAHAAAAPAPSATVRECAASPILDAFADRYRESVHQLLAQGRGFVVQCIVLDASDERPGGARIRLLCRETNAAHGVKKGDIFEVLYSPGAEADALPSDTGEHLRPGQIRSFLLERRLWRTYLRVPGRVTGTLDFIAMRNACEWLEARQFIGKGGYSVVEGTLAPAERPRNARQFFDYSSITVQRVHWSAADWRVEDVRRVEHISSQAADAVEAEGIVEVISPEERTALIPPHEVPVMVIVQHHSLLQDQLVRARVR